MLLIVSGLVLVGLVLGAGFSRYLGWPGTVGLALLSVFWLAVNSPMEGGTVVSFTPDRGITAADFAGLAAFVVASWQALLLWRKRS